MDFSTDTSQNNAAEAHASEMRKSKQVASATPPCHAKGRVHEARPDYCKAATYLASTGRTHLTVDASSNVSVSHRQSTQDGNSVMTTSIEMTGFL